MQTVLDRRRENLRALIEQWNGPLALSKKLGYNTAAFMVQMAGPNPSREVSEKTARMIERELGLPAQWMDAVHDQQQGVGKADKPSKGKALREKEPQGRSKVSINKPDENQQDATLDTVVIGQVIRLVGQAAEDLGVNLSPDRLSHVVLMVYDDAVAHGEIRESYVQQLLLLLK